MKDEMPSLRPLTSFRLFAALAVFFHHMASLFCERPRLKELYHAYYYEGFAGVSFFFVLSGFILTYNYQRVFASLKVRQVWAFYVARVARIYPLHVLSFLVLVVVTLGSWRQVFSSRFTDMLDGKAIANLTLTQSFVADSGYYFAFNGPSWSLSDEMFFYAALPLLLWVLTLLHLRQPVRAAVLGVALWGFALWYTWSSRLDPLFHWRCYINPLYRLVDFSVGMCLCLVFLGLQGSRAGRPGRTVATGLELGALGLLGAAVVWSGKVPFAVRLGAYYTPAMAAVILVFALQRGYLSRLLSARPFLVLGEVSFAFYLFHIIAFIYLTKYTALLQPGRYGPQTRMGLLLAVIVAVSYLCHYCYERPMRGFVKWLLLGKPQQRRAPVPEVLPADREVARAA
jgi:peptidoglycan/LPS O-acetylase OafA/YrhL